MVNNKFSLYDILCAALAVLVGLALLPMVLVTGAVILIGGTE